MRRALLLASPLLALAGCATLGTNVSGNFNCSAPKGGCAPTSVIDGAATGGTGATALDAAALPRRVAPGGDTARTGERILKIVFPAHIDVHGTLHEEAIAYAVAEGPDWAVAKRGRAALPTMPTPSAFGGIADIDFSLSSLAARDGSPSTPREAIAGAAAPVIEGFDASLPLDARTPRSIDPGDLPSDAAINAAKERAKGRKLAPVVGGSK